MVWLVVQAVVRVEQSEVQEQRIRVMLVVETQAVLTSLRVVVVVHRQLVRTVLLLVTAVLAEQVFRHPLLVRQLVVRAVAVEEFLQMVVVVLQLMVVLLEFATRQQLTLRQTGAVEAVVEAQTVAVRHQMVGLV
jgi:hypothetical protein